MIQYALNNFINLIPLKTRLPQIAASPVPETGSSIDTLMLSIPILFQLILWIWSWRLFSGLHYYGVEKNQQDQYNNIGKPAQAKIYQYFDLLYWY